MFRYSQHSVPTHNSKLFMSPFSYFHIILSVFLYDFEPLYCGIRSCTTSSVSVCASCLLPSQTSQSSMLSWKEIMRGWNASDCLMRSLQTSTSYWLNVVSATSRRSSLQVPPTWLPQVGITMWPTQSGCEMCSCLGGQMEIQVYHTAQCTCGETGVEEFILKYTRFEFSQQEY